MSKNTKQRTTEYDLENECCLKYHLSYYYAITSIDDIELRKSSRVARILLVSIPLASMSKGLLYVRAVSLRMRQISLRFRLLSFPHLAC